MICVIHFLLITFTIAISQRHIILKTQFKGKQTANISGTISGSKALTVHCHSDVCSAPCGHSTGCRTFWVCLQHHAAVVISNIVTVCGSRFPSKVSKHCQNQHTEIPHTIPAMCNATNPCSCNIQGAASSGQHHGSPFS